MKKIINVQVKNSLFSRAVKKWLSFVNMSFRSFVYFVIIMTGYLKSMYGTYCEFVTTGIQQESSMQNTWTIDFDVFVGVLFCVYECG